MENSNEQDELLKTSDETRPVPETPEPRSALGGQGGIDKAQVVISGFLIAVVGVIAYSNAVSLPFHLDDQRLIVSNESLHRLTTVPDAWNRQALRPAAALSLAFNWMVGGGSPGLFHAFSLLVHVLNGILLFLIARHLLPKGTGEAIAMVAGMLFVAHPALSQTVNHLPARSTLIGTFFILTSVVLYLRATTDPERPRYISLVASVVCFVVAWLADAIGWITPVILVLVTFARARERGHGVMANASALLPFGVVLAGLAFIEFAGPAEKPILLTDPAASFASAVNVGSFLKMVAVPLGLQVEHAPYPPDAGAFPWLWFVLVVVGLGLMRFAPVIGMSVLWFLLTVAAWGLVFAHESFHEKMLYLPLAGLVLAAPWVLQRLPKQAPRYFAGIALALAIIAGLALTSTRNNQWRSEAELWINAYEACPRCFGPTEHLAYLHLAQGEQIFREVAAGETGLNAEAANAEARDHLLLSRDLFAMATRFEQAPPELWGAYARSQGFLGDTEGAIVSLKTALAIDPDYIDGLAYFAILASDASERSQDPVEIRRAIDHFRRLESLGGLSPEAGLRYAYFLARISDLRGSSTLLSRFESIDTTGGAARTLEEIVGKVRGYGVLESSIQSMAREGAPREPLLIMRARQLHLDGRYVQSSYALWETMLERSPDLDNWVLLGINSAKTNSINHFLEDWPAGPLTDDDPEAWRKLVEACAASNAWQASYVVFQHLAETTGAPLEPWHAMAELALKLEDRGRAALYYQRVIDERPEDPAGWIAMAEFLLDHDQKDGARYIISRAEQAGAAPSVIEALKERAGVVETDTRGLRRTIIR